MDSVLTIPSVLIRLMAMVWTIVMVVRSRDWRLAFLPLLLLVMALQPMLPHLSKWDAMVMQVAVLTVLVVSMLYVLVRRKNHRWGGTALGGLLMLVTLYQAAALLTGSWTITLGPSHSEFSVSLLLCLTVVLFGQLFSDACETRLCKTR